MPTLNSYGRSIDQILALKHRDESRMRAKFMDELRDLVGNTDAARAAASPLDLPPNARTVALCDMARLEISRLASFATDHDDAKTYFNAIAVACRTVGAGDSARVFHEAAGAVASEAALEGLAVSNRSAVEAEVPARLRAWVASHKQAIEAET